MRIIKAILLSVFACWAACSKISMPTDFSSVTSGTRANLKANFDEVQTKFNPCADSVDEVRGRFNGYTSSLKMSSLDHLMLRLDTDGNLTGLFGILNGASGDTVFRVSEDSAWRFVGAGTGTSLTLSGALTANSLNGAFSGSVAGTNGTFSGTLGVTGAITASNLTASLPVFTNGSKVLVSNAITGTGNVVMSASPTLTGTITGAAATFSGTLGVTGLSTLGGVEIIGGSAGAGRMYQSGSLGFNIQGRTGSTYDFSITQPSGSPNYLLRVPTGTSTVEVPGALSAGATLGVVGLQSNSEAIAFTANGTSGAGRIFKSSTNGLQLRGVTGSSYDFAISDAAGNLIAINPTGTSELQLPNAAGISVTGPATFATNFTQSAGTHSISVTDNTANAVDIQQGSNNYINLTTANGAEVLALGNATTNPAISLLGTGVKTIDGTINTDLTASRTVVTDGSGNLSVNTETGTGNHVRATSPSVTSPTVATSLTASYATASTAAEFDGSKNLVSVTKTGTGNDVYSSSPTLTGIITAAAANFSGSLTASQITLGGGEAFTYGDTSFTVTLTGVSSTVTGTAYATKIGKKVTLLLPVLQGTSNTTSMTVTGIPSNLYPASGYIPTSVVIGFSNSAQVQAWCTLVASEITCSTTASGSGWITSGTKGFGSSLSFAYITD